MADEIVDRVPPNPAQDLMNKAWEKHVAGQYEQAVVEFQQALTMDDSLIDAYYGLGLSLKAEKRNQEAITSFKRVIELVPMLEGDDRARAEMLRRLSIGHINLIQSGDWGLEGEIWQHTN